MIFLSCTGETDYVRLHIWSRDLRLLPPFSLSYRSFGSIVNLVFPKMVLRPAQLKGAFWSILPPFSDQPSTTPHNIFCNYYLCALMTVAVSFLL